MKCFRLLFVFVVLFLSSCQNSKTNSTQSSTITAEMAYEGISNYCHSEYDWSIAEDVSGSLSQLYWLIRVFLCR